MADELASLWLPIDFEFSVGYEDYLADLIPQETEITSVTSFPYRLEGEMAGRVLILCNTELFPYVEDNLHIWAADMRSEGFEVLLVAGTFETPKELRDSLYDLWASDEGLLGCILVGDFPVPWFAHADDFDHDAAIFPIDLYYEDLDGRFMDFDADGMFDEHRDGSFGDTLPEIWLGRLTPSTLEGDEALYINRYLERNHLYRTGQFALPRRALLFIDDDWVHMTRPWEEAVGSLYDEYRVINDREVTNAEEYLERISQGYEWVDVMVHSSPETHAFKWRDMNSLIYSDEMSRLPINSFFLVPFSCSNARYVEPDYFGAWYIFGENTNGLCSIGSTKAGSLYYGTSMYEQLSGGASIGDAFGL